MASGGAVYAYEPVGLAGPLRDFDAGHDRLPADVLADIMLRAKPTRRAKECPLCARNSCVGGFACSTPTRGIFHKTSGVFAECGQTRSVVAGSVAFWAKHTGTGAIGVNAVSAGHVRVASPVAVRAAWARVVKAQTFLLH